MFDVNLSKSEKAVLRKIGRAGRKEMLRKLGLKVVQSRPDEIAHEQQRLVQQLHQHRDGGKPYFAVLEKIGVNRLAEISRLQGEHGEDGGRPTLYKPCSNTKPDAKFRSHRFTNGVCACGQEQLAKPINSKTSKRKAPAQGPA